ncbi:hypothetical protein [Gordonia rhizosphera]|uniref:hypothetical protein n=1 Tax=Gordonia rhizosphera TaxID=83341 RepID=UPI0012F653B8|nr:hypothetical protein [Gordonia rhizosphera]
MGFAGSMRGAQVILGPVVVVEQGLLASILPKVLECQEYGKYVRIRVMSIVFSAIMFLGVMIYCLILCVVPSEWVASLLGGVWDIGRQFLIPMSLLQAFSGISLGATLAFRGLRNSSKTVVVRSILAPVPFIFSVPALVLWGETAAIWALVFSGALGGVFLWAVFFYVRADLESAASRVGTEVLD